MDRPSGDAERVLPSAARRLLPGCTGFTIAEMTATTLEAGVQLGGYTLVKEIGQGAAARVYAARVEGAMGFSKDVALKIVHDELASSQPQLIRSLINEARIGGLLSHPNVVQIFDFEEVEGRHVLVMEYVEGPTFRHVLEALCPQDALLPPALVAEIGAHVCRALQYAIDREGPDGKKLNLVHRDIKPENLILAPGGLVKVLDFGIARSTANLYLTTTLNLTRGTPCYMSPEQLRGEELDGRSDLFSLGCVLYELLTGEVLFKEAGIKLVKLVLEGDLSEQFARVHERSPALAGVLARLLERPVRKRCGDALEAEQSLIAVAKAEPVSLDLADVSRMMASGQTPQWEPVVTTTAEEVGPPPSGKAFGFWDWLKNFFGY